MIISIKPYEARYRDGVVNVLQYLWPWDEQERYSRFEWEYFGNPSHPEPLAIVAVNEDDDVVGFRGWVPGKIRSNDRSYLVARAADAVVSPKGRRQGVFTKMTLFSLNYLRENGVDAILNLTSNEQSNPGNLKLGWVAIGRLNIWCKIVLPIRFNKSLNDLKVIKTKDYSIEIMPNIPEGMSIQNDSDKITFSMLEGQLDWFAKCPMGKYISFVLKNLKGRVVGVCIFRENGKRKASLVYTNFKDEFSGRLMLKYAFKYLPAWLITVWGMALSKKKAHVLSKAGFLKIPFFEKIRKDPPILVRCMNDPMFQEGWFLGDRDIRDMNNWELNSIDLF